MERLSGRLGLPEHHLSPHQLVQPPSKRATTVGQLIGISIGCVLGLAPLLFIGDEEERYLAKRLAAQRAAKALALAMGGR